jgi:hypothetical protein
LLQPVRVSALLFSLPALNCNSRLLRDALPAFIPMKTTMLRPPELR